jgi:hypothetical protein
MGLAAKTEWITFLAGTGAIVLTFLAGAELDPVIFRTKWKEATAVGLVGFFGPFLGCTAVGDRKAYDLEIRPRLMVHAIEQLQNAQVEPDVWKIEGLDRREDCENLVAAARQGGRESVCCIILGRGEDDKKVNEWLANAAGVPGFIGLAVGRTDFWQPLVEWRANKITREEAVAAVSRRYREFVSIFEQASLVREKRESKMGGAAG